jgi:predicted amidohydrolase YtcJ
MYSATTRKSFLDPDPHHPVTQDLAITGLEKMSIGIEDAVRCYTLGSAFSIRQEDRLGSLEPGKLADFVVVDIDPFQQNLTCLRDAQRAVRDTWMSGVKVWRRDASQD